ncbi:winged helix DNA-binding domain-containing protein [Nocardiopsis sp. CT-R113]|uniref:Winged helix DNA-binding domain-containing protein n=1 Tax=Nocardiopsis codii TaxID=3065942 RepID=A0ABU7K4B1_9ACTN|nr:winged helix DNA-binding domain-containing protein [Nocardiopsis sp. CT-R113]MEE2037078.1 winged helix DNA-binding domain-containing protein [Nocardiopsis sp. CT-R113]
MGTPTTWQDMTARRLWRHALTSPGASTADVVGAMCGAHAQIMSAAEVSVGLRLADTDRTHVRAALWDTHELVKTFGPRGTVHLLPTRELPLWTAALTAAQRAGNPAPKGALLTPEQTEELVEGAAAVLADAEMTVDELTEALAARVGSWAADPVMDAFQAKWPRWRQATHTLANRGSLCFGPMHGRKVTYTSPHRWLPGFTPADTDQALAHVVTGYLRAYGPATPQHFAQWLSAPRRWASELFASLGELVEPVEVEGHAAYRVAGDTEPAPAPAPDVLLLPYFDAYTVGCHPRDVVFPGPARERALARGQAGNYPVLYLDGLAAGIWHQRRSGRHLDVTVEALVPLSPARREAVAEQADRVGLILQATPRLTFGTVTVGPHA